MSTVFDVPMHDFSGEGSMDTDMVPLLTPDVDWLQVENMIEDDVSKQLAAQEVEMIRESVVQEFEMEVAGDADIPDYIDSISAEHLLPHLLPHHLPHHMPESFDQEIPDASRATSPTPVVLSFGADAQAANVSITLEADEGLREIDPTIQSGNVYEETNLYSSHIDHEASDHHVLPSQTEPEVPYALQETLDTTREEYDPQHLGHSEDRREESTAHFTEVAVVSLPSDDAVQTVTGSVPLLEEVQANREEDHVSSDKNALPAIYDSSTSTRPRSVASEHAQQHTLSSSETHLTTQPEGQIGLAVSSIPNLDDESEESLIEPPPCVLLSYLFDNSHYHLFQSPEKNHPEIGSGDAAELKDSEPSASDLNKTESQNVLSQLHPTLLFAEQSDLYFSSLSQIFQAIRNDHSINTGGRFDENIELVITVVGLDLRLPEDNIHSREVSLDDLSVLHIGCELTGPLSLQLDTVAPRFGTRYKAIRDALVSIVSSTDDHAHDQEQAPYTESQEDPKISELAAPEEPALSAPPEKINDGSFKNANNVENADTTEETRQIIDSHSTKADEFGEDEEAENLYENENETENEGTNHAEQILITDSREKPDDAQDEYFDEDAEGEYEEEEQDYESTHGDVDTLYHSQNQEENTLLDENPQAEEIDFQDPETETLAVGDNQYLTEGPIQDGLTPEPNSPGSEEGSLYDETLIHEESIDNIASQNGDLSSTQNVVTPRARAPSSKRSFDEHEIGQYEEDGGSPDSTDGANQKRSRLN